MRMRHVRRGAVLAAVVLSSVAHGAGDAAAVKSQAVIDRPAIRSLLAQRSLLTAVSAQGRQVVAVGERGHIVVSQDGGATWQQAASPVSVTLTCVQLVDAQQGWAAGHGGVILHTADGGRTWVKQLDGRGVIQALQRSPESTPVLRDLAQQWAGEGPDKPFLDLRFSDALHGLVVGAYGMAFRTEDGGKTWQSVMHRIANPENRHLYAIAAQGDVLYLAGEQGLLLHSDGQGGFERLTRPYNGSFFALTVSPSGALLALGLRGNLYRSEDEGRSWTRLDLGLRHSLTSGTVLPDGQVLLVDEAGAGWVSDRFALRFRPVRFAGASALSGVAVARTAADGALQLVLVGLRGVTAAPLTGLKTGT